MDFQEQLSQFDFILFDLGGVIIDLDYNATVRAFQEMGHQQFNEIYSQAVQTDLFDRYEMGQLSSPHFINQLKGMMQIDYSPNQLVHAWNKMILRFRPEKLAFLETLRTTKTIGLLSNINDLHEDYVKRKLKDVSSKQLEDFFDYTFLSHRIGMRKPNEETFIYVCKQMGVQPHQVLFIDDSKQHIEGAKKVGLATYLFPQNEGF
ncbi:MAG: HAD family phosphatase [Crocinitomicaceae bacterium]|nr:HAD family phosphatase [Crocinitomicaceae bacterium]